MIMTKICITKNKQMSLFFICTEMKAFIHRIIKNMYSKMPHLRISINNYKTKYCSFINVP